MWFVDLKSPFFLSFHFETTKLRICFLFDLRILYETLNLSPFRLLIAFQSYVNRIWKAKLLKSFRRVRKTNSDRPAVCRLCFCILCAEQNIRAISHLVTEVKVIAFRRVKVAQNIITSRCIIIAFGVCVLWSRFKIWRHYVYSTPASFL